MTWPRSRMDVAGQVVPIPYQPLRAKTRGCTGGHKGNLKSGISLLSICGFFLQSEFDIWNFSLAASAIAHIRVFRLS